MRGLALSLLLLFWAPRIYIYNTRLVFLGHKNTPARRGSERAVYIKDYPGSTTHEIISVVEQASQPLFCTIKSVGRMGAETHCFFHSGCHICWGILMHGQRGATNGACFASHAWEFQRNFEDKNHAAGKKSRALCMHAINSWYSAHQAGIPNIKNNLQLHHHAWWHLLGFNLFLFCNQHQPPLLFSLIIIVLSCLMDLIYACAGYLAPW